MMIARGCCQETAEKRRTFPQGLKPGLGKLQMSELSCGPRWRFCDLNSMSRGVLRKMDGTSTVGAEVTIPAIAVARNPCVDFCCDPVNSRNQKNPGEPIPAGEKESDARPGISAAPDTPACVYPLHRAHGHFAIDLWETSLRGRVIEAEKLDPLVPVKALHARNTGAAKAATSIVKNREFGHV